MTTIRLCCAVILAAAVFTAGARAQQGAPPKPGPEHAMLKKMEGTWDATVKMGGNESKATSVYKMDLGGFWLTSKFEGMMEGQKFSGRGYDGYDPMKKKFVGVWFDSMSPTPFVLEGDYNKETKTMTMTGDAPGPDGKMARHKLVTTMPDDDTMNFAMYVGGTKEPMMTIAYKRKADAPQKRSR